MVFQDKKTLKYDFKTVGPDLGNLAKVQKVSQGKETEDNEEDPETYVLAGPHKKRRGRKRDNDQEFIRKTISRVQSLRERL